MCPWPRFQAAMLDEQSVIVTYQKWRGEPRGKHKAGDSWDGRGDCVDCQLCVNVCPTGIDIRDGQQIECIGCGLCVDACNETMRKVDRPLGLIRWDTLARQEAREKGRSAPWRPVRPRTILYAAMFAVVAIVMAVTFFLRTTADLSAQRDRSPNFVRLSSGDIRNSYTIKISNKDQHERRFMLELEGLPGATLAIANMPNGNPSLPVHADSVGTFRVLVTVPAAKAPSGSHGIEFRARDEAGVSTTHDSVFVGPSR
jgi:cytochrome c oxidase accessory protein FixG